MKCIVNGRIIQPEGLLDGRTLAFDARIEGILDAPPPGAEIIDAAGGYVSPGLIDVHCHGFRGMSASHASLAEVAAMSAELARHGVTAWLPTTMTLPRPGLEACFAALREAMAASTGPDWAGARVLGCHAEGPFISPARKGAQSGADILPPDIDRLRSWADVVRLMTVAPEVPGMLDFIRQARALGIVLSMGHTDATTAQAQAGIEAGIDHATHLFNAMPPLNHREPGPVGVALSDRRVYCELIADTFHVSPLLFAPLMKLLPDRLVLITDAIEVAGLPDGPHDQLGQRGIVAGIRCRFPDGTIAGSALTLDRAVRNFARHADIPLWQAANLASLHPARSLGLAHRMGALRPGMEADIVIADEAFHVARVFIGGRER